MSIPEHKNPQPERMASAPYNFVPLPEKIIPAVSDASELPGHDEYDRERLSGYFDVTLTTRSPLYIRGPLPIEDFMRQEQNRQNKGKQDQQPEDRPEFFHTGDERTPVIPGSSLRGMLRSLLEIVSYSKVKWVSEKQLFFRTIDNTAVGKYYNSRMVEELGTVQEAGYPRAPGYHARVKGGFFRVQQDGTCFIEACTVARVETRDLLRLFGLQYNRELYQLDGRDLNQQTERKPNQTPNWSYQHREIWADIDRDEENYFFPRQVTRDRNNRERERHPDFYLRFQRARNLAKTPVRGNQSGKLVLTGNMVYKHLAFLFVPLERPASPIKVPNDPQEENANKRLVDRFHDNDQLTQWQTKAFPVDRSPTVPPQPDGRLRDGDPVFFLCDTNGDLVFFGRAQMFRLPYMRSPLDLVPEALRSASQIDYAEALFGFVRTREELQELKDLGISVPKQGDRGRAYAGRVTITDAVLQPGQENIWLMEDFKPAVIPKILASPKPTAFQHYLTQQQPDEKGKLDHYDSGPAKGDLTTTIRGHKLYWHQGLDTNLDLDLEQIRKTISDGFAQAGEAPLDSQHTLIKPLKPGVTFSFRVSFENLSERELGALCWTLRPRGVPGQRYCHHLGMGKPLGMGSVELRARLHLIDRSRRYSTLFSGDTWQLGESVASEHVSAGTAPAEEESEAAIGEDLALPDVLERWTKPFEQHLLDELNPSPPCENLRDMLRIAMLLKMLAWPGYQAVEKGERYLKAEHPPRPNTRYMQIKPDNEYSKRYVLPDPTEFDRSYFQNKSRPRGSERDAGPAPPKNPVVTGEPAKDPDMQKAEDAIRGLGKLRESEVAGQIHGYYQRWQQLKSGEARQLLARAIVAKVRQARREKATAEKPWYQELLASLLEENDAHAASD
jgi:CRISPR-associated protein (TIGR03986 family)